MADTIGQQYIEKPGGGGLVTKSLKMLLDKKCTLERNNTYKQKIYIRKLSPSKLNMLIRTKKLKFPASKHDCKNTTITVRHKQK